MKKITIGREHTFELHLIFIFSIASLFSPFFTIIYHLRIGQITFEENSKRTDYFIYMHLIYRITEISAGTSKSMRHVIKSPMTAIVTKINAKCLIKWQLFKICE